MRRKNKLSSHRLDIRKHLILLITLLWLSHVAAAQSLSQVVKGMVRDHVTGHGIVGANVTLTSSQHPAQGVVSDEQGVFRFDNVAPGVYMLRVSFTGYQSLSEEVQVIAGRETQWHGTLREASQVLEAVEVRGGSPTEPGAHTFTIDKTMRMPANFFDPVRLATAYPNVVAANDQGNAMIVKGNSPNGLLWRLNGIDVVNPNHLANAGTLSDKPMANGGGVNMLSAQMLDRTRLYTGPFPNQFGNALSGVLDMKLRDGNREKREYTAQASVLGLDVAAEGPWNGNHRSAYLVNYRYSTVGLLSKLGVKFGDEDIAFQDLSFQSSFTQRDGGQWSVFGLYGSSVNDFDGKPVDEVEEEKDTYEIRYKSKTYVAGVRYERGLGMGRLSLTTGYSHTDESRNQNMTDANLAAWMAMPAYPATAQRIGKDVYAREDGLLSTHVRYRLQWRKGWTWEVGALVNQRRQSLEMSNVVICPGCGNVAAGQRGIVSGWLLQPYTTLSVPVTSRAGLRIGVRDVYFTYNDTHSLEPRADLDIQTGTASSVTVAYALTSQTQQPGTYLQAGNRALGLTRAHHTSVVFRQAWAAWQTSTELYYQHLFDIPVSTTEGAYSVFNLLEATALPALQSRGTADNYGVSTTAERRFVQAYYMVIGASYYRSRYEGSDGIQRHSRFDGRYTVNVTYGKEWTKPTRNRTIGLSTRMLYLGGLRQSAVMPASALAAETIYNTNDPFGDRLHDYFRIDLRLSLRKDKPGYTRTLALDIQNLLGEENEAYRYYDHVKRDVVLKRQLGLIPVLVYRVDF